MSSATTPILKTMYLAFWLASLILLALGFKYKSVPSPDNIFTCNVLDNYYVVEIYGLCFFLAAFYFLLGLGYWFAFRLNGRLNQFLCYLHAIIMFLPLLIYIILKTASSDDAVINTVIIISFASILFIAQPAYVINLMLGIFNWRKDKNSKI